MLDYHALSFLASYQIYFLEIQGIFIINISALFGIFLSCFIQSLEVSCQLIFSVTFCLFFVFFSMLKLFCLSVVFFLLQFRALLVIGQECDVARDKHQVGHLQSLLSAWQVTCELTSTEKAWWRITSLCYHDIHDTVGQGDHPWLHNLSLKTKFTIF